jgi:hypothetical protein
VESTGSGRVVIWIVLPTRFATMNMSMPSYDGQSAAGIDLPAITDLPPPALVGRPPFVVILLLLLEQVRLAL